MAGYHEELNTDELAAVIQRNNIAHRRDLADSFGFILIMPPGESDMTGKRWYGIWGPPTTLSSEAGTAFVDDIRTVLKDRAYPLVEQGIATKGELPEITTHEYQIGPASESWPSYFFDIYHVARPFLGDDADLLAWGYFFKSVLEGIKGWADDKNREWPKDESVKVRDRLGGDAPVAPKWEPISPVPVLTRMANVSLCFQHAVDKYGLGGTVSVDTFPRGWYYGDVDHPQGWESYLIRIVAGNRQFYYQVAAGGLVQQHFLITDPDVTLLDLPDFGHPGYQEGHRALSADRIQVTVS